MNKNAEIIEKAMDWIDAIIKNRVMAYFDSKHISSPGELDGIDDDSFFSHFINLHELSRDEIIVVLLALAPEIKPEILDQFLIRNHSFDKHFTEFGGICSSAFNGFIPTFKTAYFILGGHRISEQMKFAGMFRKQGKLFKSGILKQVKSDEITPETNTPLCLSESTLAFITSGKEVEYEYSSGFPARKLTTLMEWEDLVLHETTKDSLKELLAWPAHGRTMIESLEMSKHIQPGYRALFHGPSGTGKTLTASLLGKKVKKSVYRIDLSQLVSKYIGETEKNLEKIFTASAHRDWILFFDEADALFGKRTSIGSSNDRFANQETAFLLQRIEVCDNIVILATNLKANLDQAFVRRFQSIIYFPMPSEDERLKIWQGAFPGKVRLEESINLGDIARKYDISGGSIINVVRYAAVMAVSSGTVLIRKQDLMDGIRREYHKQGRTL